MPQHFVNLPGAATLPTRQYQLTGQIIDDLIAELATGVVHGPAGTGKTYAVEARQCSSRSAPPSPERWSSCCSCRRAPRSPPRLVRSPPRPR